MQHPFDSFLQNLLHFFSLCLSPFPAKMDGTAAKVIKRIRFFSYARKTNRELLLTFRKKISASTDSFCQWKIIFRHGVKRGSLIYCQRGFALLCFTVLRYNWKWDRYQRRNKARNSPSVAWLMIFQPEGCLELERVRAWARSPVRKTLAWVTAQHLEMFLK